MRRNASAPPARAGTTVTHANWTAAARTHLQLVLPHFPECRHFCSLLRLLFSCSRIAGPFCAALAVNLQPCPLGWMPDLRQTRGHPGIERSHSTSPRPLAGTGTRRRRDATARVLVNSASHHTPIPTSSAQPSLPLGRHTPLAAAALQAGCTLSGQSVRSSTLAGPAERTGRHTEQRVGEEQTAGLCAQTCALKRSIAFIIAGSLRRLVREPGTPSKP